MRINLKKLSEGKNFMIRNEGKTYHYCGREFSEQEIETIQKIIFMDPTQTRTEISKLVCQALEWLKPNGGLKDMSCRIALSKMYNDGLILLPPSKREAPKKIVHRIQRTSATDPDFVIDKPVDQISDLSLVRVQSTSDSKLWNEFIDRYHYIGYATLSGAQIRYFVYSQDQILAVLGFDSSAWQLGPRDRFIGWTSEQRQKNLHLVINNARFLILPWVYSKNLASKILSMASRQILIDWPISYNYKPVLIETFVQQNTFSGVSYKAANWIKIGQTKGRGKLDNNLKKLPIKDIWLFPLDKNFRQLLCQ